MVDRLFFYGKRLVSLFLALPAVQRYRLQRAYLLDAYDQFPMLRQRMVVLWLKLAPVVGVGLSIGAIGLPTTARFMLALSCILYFLSLYPQVYRIQREDSCVMRIYRLSCDHSRFLQHISRRYTGSRR